MSRHINDLKPIFKLLKETFGPIKACAIQCYIAEDSQAKIVANIKHASFFLMSLQTKIVVDSKKK
jgi:hypothetical protein